MGVAVRTRTCGAWPCVAGFVHQLLALQDAEAMLLVNGDDAQTRENDVIFDERVSANDQLCFAVGDAFARGGLFGEALVR